MKELFQVMIQRLVSKEIDLVVHKSSNLVVLHLWLEVAIRMQPQIYFLQGLGQKSKLFKSLSF